MIATEPLRAAVLEHLPAHLGQQRWSGTAGTAVVGVEPVWLDVVRSGDPLLVWALVEAELADGRRNRYQVFIGGRPASPGPRFLAGKERQILGMVPGDDGEIVLYDALVDPDLAIAVLHLTSPDTEVGVRRPIVLEHSNSSVVFDEAIILKVFRKILPGPNPDVVITRTLAERGCPHVQPSLGELERDGTHLAVLRPFLAGATQGWEIARTSVRDILASRLPPEESGGDLAADSARLGDTIASLHLCMTDAWGATPGRVSGWVDEMEAHLEALLAGPAGALDPDALDVAAVREHLAAARAVTDAGQEIRIHGDLHLAQVIEVDAGWVVIDFEGEPDRPPEARFTASSPLRDVAGVLRSYHYAAESGLAEWDRHNGDLAPLLAAWERRNRDAFMEGYLGHPGVDALLPAEPGARAALLAAFELDKAIYELGYELAHRPDMVPIPLAAIRRVVSHPVTT